MSQKQEKNVGGGQFFSGIILGPNGMGNSLIAGKFREKVFVTHPIVDYTVVVSDRVCGSRTALCVPRSVGSAHFI